MCGLRIIKLSRRKLGSGKVEGIRSNLPGNLPGDYPEKRPPLPPPAPILGLYGSRIVIKYLLINDLILKPQ